MKYTFNIGDEAAKYATNETLSFATGGIPLGSTASGTYSAYATPLTSAIPPAVGCESNINFSQNIRLIIWDLDETFWKGTLTEGQITWVEEYADIVKTLATRGIISSICSKNDFEQTMQIIKNQELDSYFIFPSIDWSTKGHRIKEIIENVQLRPETVLFIDDNPLNRAEAMYMNPGINVAAESVIPHLLSHHQFVGKKDSALTRLAQYKVMERRKQDALHAGEVGADDFLRTSGIKVYIEYDLEGNLDRCVELINRTNQLNFTKVRLSDDAEKGKEEFLELLRDPRIQGGLIHCCDKYGDHGFIGLYLISEGARLKHFIFSCRVLGMGIEQWLYKRLGNPYIEIVGEVLSDPCDTRRNIDWIQLLDSKDPMSTENMEVSVLKKIDNFYVLGGCVMENIGHYLKVFSENVVHESNVRRDGIDIRRTHTSFMIYRHLLDDEQFIEAVSGLGCIKKDFDNQIFHANSKSAVILSFWYDQISVLYRHKQLPIEMPFLIDGISWDADITQLNFEDMPEEFRKAKDAEPIFRHFKNNYVFSGYISGDTYGKRLRTILSQINSNVPIFILDIPQQSQLNWGVERQIQPDMLEPIQRVHQELACENENIYIIDPIQFVLQPSDRLDWWHFDRKVYYRIYLHIAELIAKIE